MVLETEHTKDWPEEVVIFTDGASRGNPGLAAYGFVVFSTKEEMLLEKGDTLGTQTNNYAEYFAVKAALETVLQKGVKTVVLKSDSELLVRQLKGEYKVKSETLRPLFKECKILSQDFESVQFQHVKRDLNKKADALANLALDMG